MQMRQINDQYNGDPTYAELHVLTRERPLAREMLKTAQFISKKAAVDALPSTAFAWESERRFPIHTREDAVASVLYRSKLGSSVPTYVDAKLAKASEIYGLEAHVFTSTKTAHMALNPAVTAYALPEESRLPLNSAEQIKVAEEVLQRDYTRLTLEKRAEAFSRVVHAARKHAVEIQPFTQKMAGLTASSVDILRGWLGARAAATENTKLAGAYDKLAEALPRQSYMTNRKDLVKIASTIEELDRMSGLSKHYDRKLPDPLQTVFNTTKVASAEVDVCGTPVPLETLMALPPDLWESVDMPEMAQLAESGDAAQFAQVFATIPADIKNLICKQIGM